MSRDRLHAVIPDLRGSRGNASAQVLGDGPAPLRPAGGRPTRYRWVICGLLFFATTINYIDRGTLGVLEPALKNIIGWTATQYGDINAAFSLAYAIGFLLMGRLMDTVGTRWGYAIALLVWSLAAAGHALSNSVLGFAVARFALGLGEAGNFPGAIKTTAEWFPRKERALATGIFNAGSNVGAIVAPLAVPLLVSHFGWKSAFVATGLIGLLWLAFWLPIYRKPASHPRVNAAELALIHCDGVEVEEKVPWRKLLPHRQTWAFSVAKLLTDPVWWFYLFWSGKFFAERFNVSIKEIGLPLVIIYLMADIGSVGGGFLSSALLSRGWSVNAARKAAMLLCALCVLPVCLAPVVSNLWIAVGVIGLAAAAHQGFSANLYTLTSDLFPRRAVGSIMGIGGMAGAAGGIAMQLCAGRIYDATGSYLTMFVIAGIVYLLAFAILHLLAPRLEPVQLPPQTPQGGFPVILA